MIFCKTHRGLLLAAGFAAALGGLTTGPAAAQHTTWEFFDPRPREFSRLAKPPQTMAIEFGGRRVDPRPTWTGLGEEDRAAIRKVQDPALGAGDEPPYPTNGLRPLIERFHSVRGPLNQPLRVDLQVGPLGRIEVVAIEGAGVPKDFAGQVMTLMENSGFKPGLCGGKICSRPFTFEIVYLGH